MVPQGDGVESWKRADAPLQLQTRKPKLRKVQSCAWILQSVNGEVGAGLASGS